MKQFVLICNCLFWASFSLFAQRIPDGASPRSLTVPVPRPVFERVPSPLTESVESQVVSIGTASPELLTYDSLVVDFVIPRHAYQTPNGCATPVPTVVADRRAGSRGNCPFVVPCDNPVNRDAAIPAPTDPIKYINVRWTVVQNGGANTNISAATVQNLMTELNQDYAPWRIQFCLQGASFVNSATFYDLNVSTEDGPFKGTYADSTGEVLNVYAVGSISSGGGLIGGYARFPYDPWGGTNVRGGVVISRGNLFVGNHTLAHEIGHTFGLHHTFRGVSEVPTCSNCYEEVTAADGSAGNGDREGDYCSDTHPHSTNAFACNTPTGQNTCDLFPWNNAPVSNFMSYSFCYTDFTAQQAGRMHCMIDSYLQPWVTFGNATCGNQPPDADFFGNPNIYAAPASVSFTDQTAPVNVATSWFWEFDVTNVGGGSVTPATFTGQMPPAVSYPNPGNYTVRLTINSPNGQDIETKASYIRVLAPTSSCDTLDGPFFTPSPTPTPYILNFNAYNLQTGVSNDYPWDVSNPTVTSMNTGFYERYATPAPGATLVGGAFIGLWGFEDADSSMRVNLVVYNDDGAGAPDLGSGPIASATGFEPGGDLGVSNLFTPAIYSLPFLVPAAPTTAFFHVGVEITGINDSLDRLGVVSSRDGEGQNDSSVHSGPTLYNYLTDGRQLSNSLDIDLLLIPYLGEAPPFYFLESATQFIDCDTTYLILVDTLFFNQTHTSTTFTLADGTILTDTIGDQRTIRLFAQDEPGPFTLDVESVNDCGRSFSTSFTFNYEYNETPPSDFLKLEQDPICTGTAVTFVSTTPDTGDIRDFFWDFGDGDTLRSTNDTVTHVYANPGTYYTELTVTDTFDCASTALKSDFVQIVDCAVSAPAAAFSQNPTSPCPFETVQFTDASVAQPDAATGWIWDFGDGSFSAQQNPTHSFSNPGTYTVRLIATNSGGRDTFEQAVTVQNCPLRLSLRLEGWHVDGQNALLGILSEVVPGGSFELERTESDRDNFVRLQSVAAGSAPSVEFLDDAPAGNTYRYRLRYVAPDGETRFSNVVELAAGAAELAVRVAPNPLQGDDLLRISIFSETPQRLRFRLLDAQGRLVRENVRIVEETGVVLHTLKLPPSPGIYFLEVADGSGRIDVRRIMRL